MKELLINWPNIKKLLLDKSIVIFLDYDGTLVPITATPKKALLPENTRKILAALEENKQCAVAIISGRSLKNIKRVVGIKGIIYAGNHGMEIKGLGMDRSVKLPASYIRNLNILTKELRKELVHIKGILIEEKGHTVSVHYRLVNKARVLTVKKIFNRIILPFLKDRQINLTRGKEVFEIRPPIKWDKGNTVLYILDEGKKNNWRGRDILPIYIGDDVTD